MEDDGWETKDVSLGASMSVSPISKSSNFVVRVVLSYSSGTNFLK